MRNRLLFIGILVLLATVAIAGCTEGDMQQHLDDLQDNTDSSGDSSGDSDSTTVTGGSCDGGSWIGSSCGDPCDSDEVLQHCTVNDNTRCQAHSSCGEPDSDGDGVPDSEDNCPDTWGDSATGCDDGGGL